MRCLLFVLLALTIVSNAFSGTFPKDKLPPYITPLTDVGQRAEWSHDGATVMFLTRAGGEVMEIDLQTKETRSITEHIQRPEGWGYYRALYLPNGDFLLTGGPRRHEAYLQIMDKSLTKQPKVFDLIIREGPALSRKIFKIAYTKVQDKIWVADVVYRHGEPFVENDTLIIDNKNVTIDGIKYEGMVEPQNFRPPDDKELIWSQYGNDDRGIFTAETMGYNMENGELVNYSKAPNQYDEPEGIFPSGDYTLTECDRHHNLGTGYIDVYRLALDGTGSDYVRLTHFSDAPGFRGTNPVVSDDGQFIVFQESRSDSPPGAGEGLYLLDLEKMYNLKAELRPAQKK